jgi:UDP-N-acetylmuramoylalanine--D-glutamate ligase
MLPHPPSEIAALLKRPVAVLGAGVSGQGVQTLLAALDALGVIYDERAEGARKTFDTTVAATHQLVIFSPGFPPEHPWLAVARAAGCTCLGELDFASLFWRGEVVAITGTNGKTTLTEFLAHALNAAGRPAAVTGNIGYPFSRFVVEQPAATIAVCEVSSFQSETLCHLRPTSTLWTNFGEDHLERHPGMPAYFAAKARLLGQTASGFCVVGSSVAAFALRSDHKLPPNCAVHATEGKQPDARLAGTVFATYPQYENFLLAAAWWRQAGLPEAALFASARSFKLGAHRLTRVGEKRGVTFWNDSKATNFHAVEAALAGFAQPVLWIGGGKAKGGDLGAFVQRIARRVKQAFLIGETKQILAGHCQAHGVPAQLCATLEEAVRAALVQARPGDQLVLSPGFASFDMFKGYDDRGRQFEALVANL